MRKEWKYSLITLGLLILLNWPILQIQTNDFNYEFSSYRSSYLGEISVWNKGGKIIGNIIMIPNVCVYLETQPSINCTRGIHNKPCDSGICDYTPAGKIYESPPFRLKFANEKPSNFTIKIKSVGMISVIPVIYDSKKVECSHNEMKNIYQCKDV